MKISNLSTDHPLAIIRGWVDGLSTSGAGTGAVVQMLTNNLGITLNAGDVVVIASGGITTTTTPQDTRPVGIVQDTILGFGIGPVLTQGFASYVHVTASVTANEYAETSSTAGEATQNATRRVGSFGIYLTGGTTPSALLFGTTDSGGGSFLDWVFVTNPIYGAVGDDSHDDTTAIQAAINATPTGGVCYFPIPSVAYKITGGLTIPHGMHVLGAAAFIGQYTKIHQHTANTDALVGPSATSAHGVIAGLQITGQIGGQTSGAGIKVNNSILVSRCLIQGFYDGLRITSASPSDAAFYSSVEYSFFDSASRAGIALIGIVNNFGWLNCRVDSNVYGVYIPGVGGATGGGPLSLRFIGGSIEGNTTSGLWIDGTGGGAAQNSVGLNITGTYFEQGNGIDDITIGANTTVYATSIVGCSFTKAALSGTGLHVNANHVNGLTIIGCEFESSSTPMISVDGTNGSNVLLVNNHNRNAGTYSLPATARILDETDVTPASTSTSNSPGTSMYLARADHVHDASGATPAFATPAIVFGTAAAPGAASTTIRSDSTVVAFDVTVPVTQAFSDSAATGSAAVAARRDHKHGMPANPFAGGVGLYGLLVEDGVTAPPVNLYTEDGTDWLYADG